MFPVQTKRTCFTRAAKIRTRLRQVNARGACEQPHFQQCGAGRSTAGFNVIAKTCKPPATSLGTLPIAFDTDEIARFCSDCGFRRLAVFGSVLRDDFTPASDIDLLVEYPPGRHPSLMLFRQQEELAARFLRPVDLHTPASLSRDFRNEVLADSLTIYEQA